MAKTKYIKLTDEERENLTLGYEKGERNFSRRCHSILLSNSGKKVMEIKSILEMKTTTSIRTWFRAWKKEGIEALKNKPKPGRTRKLDINNEEHVQVVKRTVKAVVEKGEDFHAKIEKELSIKVSSRTLRRFLKNLNIDGNV